MALADVRAGRSLRIDAGELAGALGDSVTVLPLVVALGALTPFSVPTVLLWFGVFQLVWGVAYGLPLSVEPMKALVGLTIAGTITAGELVAAGLLAGVVLVVAARLRALGRIESLVGEAAIRGVQLAVALLLARTGVELAAGDPTLAAASVGLVAVAAVARRVRLSSLLVLGGGAVLAVVAAGGVSPTLPSPAVFPTVPTPTFGAAEATAGQLAMTAGNAAVATSLLCSDLFDADVPPDRLAGSMGAMCLAAVPFGGLPMCHGSGGLAGKHAFGARTGGANVVLGVLYLAAACVAGVVTAFPTAVLGVLLVVVAWHLGRAAARCDRLLLVAAVGVVGLLTNVGAAFLVGAVADRLLDRFGSA
ncbi:putative sulfate/molybdate transporter [Halopelagius longus]|uniref:Molybdate transporter of MFS superfamily protein n=1 Tax=Halopelagius longus TaxID=1236180 RepID=A0A1H0XUP1_9EURY|nr:putative sulfate/molybdate transporter [Halopelagius longus]RDI72102.1 sulfate transporter [Halopelagius longus]SDQ06585.1 Molybdate transporter of MFS superfamily protein [Halopelagius longus]